jgi:NTE family protein
MAHLGLLEALDSLGIVPDLIVGTSIGAVIGALYASGENSASIAARLRALPISSAITRYEPVVSASLGGLRPVIVWERSPGGWALQPGTARENQVNALFSRLMLRANLTARGDFDSMPIPFRAIATDLEERAVVVLARGDLARAVRASSSLPLLLRPVTIDGRTLVDGALASNRPVAVARALGAERVIVSTLESPKPERTSFDDPLTVTSALFEYLWVQDSFALGPEDVRVANPTQAFDQLDFSPAAMDSLIVIGRAAAQRALAGAACVHTRTPRRASDPLPTEVGRVRLATPGVPDRDALLRAVSLVPRTPIDTTRIGLGLERVASVERYRGLWLNPSGSGPAADFDVTVDAAPTRSFGIGVAFDHTMSGRIWVGAVDRALFGRDIDGVGLLTAGTYRTDLTLAARRSARVGERYFPIGGSMEVASESVRLYQGSGELPSAETSEFTGLLGLRPLFEPGWTHEFGGDYRVWHEPGQPTRGTAGVRYAVRLRRPLDPDAAVTAEVIALRAWHRARLDLSRTYTLGVLEIRPRLRAGWGEQLPIQQTFVLGGLDGFAGLRMQERRGSQEAFGALLFRWPVWRRVLGRIEPMAGAIGNGTGFLTRRVGADGEILLGGRVGLEVDTPVGPIRVEQGFNNLGRREALIRVGTWF